MLRILLISLFLLTLNFSVSADQINEINVKGNQRLSEESIIVFSGLSINQDYDSNDLNKAIKELDKTDFFEKINFKIINDTLLIEVIENPIIEDLQIRGVKSKNFTNTIYEMMELKSRMSYKESTFYLI